MASSGLALRELVLNVKGFDGKSKLLEYGFLDIRQAGVFYFDSLKCQGWIQSVEMTFGDGEGFCGVAKYNSIWAEITHKIMVAYPKSSQIPGESVGDFPFLSTLTRVLIDGTCHEIIPEKQLDLRQIATT